MSTRRALIVDDSKSARVVLSRMLEQHNLEVDSVESAEQALEYLGHHRPDVIFMDHLMPGMDGFQAVQAIKNNPRTATIPIMMYTSQEGDLYVGQARALGASGVLPKQLKPVDVSKVLYQLNLMPERQEAEVPRVVETRAPAVVVMAAEAVSSQVSSQYGSGHGKSDSVARGLSSELRAQIEGLIKDQTTELRRFVIASLDSFASRVVNDLRNVSVAPSAAPESQPTQGRTPIYIAIGAGILALVSAGLAVWFGLNLSNLGTENSALRDQVAKFEESNRQLATLGSQLSAAVAERGAGSVAPRAIALPSQPLADSAPAASGPVVVEAVPYGEVPLSSQRVEGVRAMLSQLEAQSFHGVVRVEIFSGRFCLAGNATEGYSQAPDDLAYAKCDFVGNPALDSMSPGQRQSLAFVNMVAEAERRGGGSIKVNVTAGNAEHQVLPYPNAATEGLTAGQWNRAATSNNRIEITAVAGI
jgi:CheY-like chemotaxis protein